MEGSQKFCTHCGYSEEYAPPTNATSPSQDNTQRGYGGTGGQTSNAELMTRAREVLSTNWGLAIVTFLLYSIVVGFIQAIPYIGPVVMFIVGGPFAFGLAYFALNFSRQTNPKIEDIFNGFSEFGRAFTAYLLTNLFIFGWMLLLIVPGIIKAYAYSMTYYIMLDDKTISVTDAITKSREIMDGNKFKLFCLGCRFIGWGLLCILTLGIGFLWLIPYISISMAKFYDDVATTDNPPSLMGKESQL